MQELDPVVPQHMQALDRANEVRLARCALRRRITGGEVTVADVLAAVPPEAVNMHISDLLMAQRRWGGKRVRQLLAHVPVAENRAVGQLTERQRERLRCLLGAVESVAA